MTPDEKKAKADRLVEAASLVLDGAGGSLLTTSLNKALFYLDLWALLEHGRVVTSSPFIAIKAGPVVAKYERRLIRELRNRKVAAQTEEGDSVTLLSKPLRQHLDEEEAALAIKLGKWASSHSAGWLSDYSHKNIGWIAAWSAGLGAGPGHQPKAIDLIVAMQQLAEVDDWVTSSGLDAEAASAFDAADDTQSSSSFAHRGSRILICGS